MNNINQPKKSKTILIASLILVATLGLTAFGVIRILGSGNKTVEAPTSKTIDKPQQSTSTPEKTPASTPSTTPENTSKTTTTPSTTTTPTTTTPAPTPTNIRPTKSPMNKEVNIGNTAKKQIAITFDGGASATQTPAILKILKDNNLHVTMFTTGKWAEQNPNLIKQIIADGHTLGNHTYDHQDLTRQTDAQITDEFAKTETIIKNLTGTTTKPYFRPPYGARNQHVWDYAASLGYQSIYWTVDAWDWKTDATPEIVKQRIYDNAKPGAIVLMHLGDDITPQVLQEVITHLQSQDYSIVTLEQVLQ